jgi:hypothetical protein
MWVTCYGCEGIGFSTNDTHKAPEKNDRKEYEEMHCTICNQWRQVISPLLIGQLWVEDNFYPLTPPQSPEPE